MVQPSPLLDTVIFDLDGTLVDSVSDLRAAGNRLLTELGRPPLEDTQVRRMIGDGVPKLVERMLAASGTPVPPGPDLEPLIARFLSFYEAAPAELTRPFPGVPETVAALAGAGWTLGVCTNKPQVATENLLKAVGLWPFLGAAVGGDKAPKRKPDPRHVLAVLEALDRPPERAVMVGDNEHDAHAGRAAGLKVVLVTWGYSREPVAELEADARIDDFTALPTLLDGWTRGT